MDLKKMSQHQFQFRETYYQNPIFLQFGSLSPCILSYQCPWRLRNPKQTQTKLKFIEVETAIKIKVSSILEQLNHSDRQTERVIDFDDDEYFNDTAWENEMSTQFLQMQKTNKLIYRKTLTAIVTNCQLLVLTVQKLISIWSSRIRCQFLLTNNKLNQELSK